MFLARDKGNRLLLFNQKPEKDLSNYGWIGIKTRDSLVIDDKDLFPHLNYENGPIEVTLISVEELEYLQKKVAEFKSVI